MNQMELLKREDSRIERICEHDIGHTIDASEWYKRTLGEYWNLHCCDGCCKKWR